jgi:hypothetical protein
MKSYAPHYYLYAISAIVSEVNNMAKGVHDPAKVFTLLNDNGIKYTVVDIAGVASIVHLKMLLQRQRIIIEFLVHRTAIRNQMATFTMVLGEKNILIT